MILKNKKLPPLTPSRLERVIASSPIQFNDIKVKISLIEKARTSTTHDLNNIITQLREMYKSDCNAFSIISSSNSQKSSELAQHEKEFQLLDQKYKKFKSTASIIDILQKVDLQERIERLQNSIDEITNKSKSFGNAPQMKKKNSNSSEITKFLQMTDYNFQLLENYIYNLNKRTVIIDQNDDDADKVKEKYGSVTNLINLLKDLEAENKNLKDMEKKYFHDRLLRRYPLTKNSNMCNKLLADTLQHCFSQELDLLHSLSIDYNDTEGNDANAFLKEESDPSNSTIEKMKNEILELEQQIDECSNKNVPELDFNKIHSINKKFHSINQECVNISQKIKKMIDEKNYYAKKSYEIETKLKKLQKDQKLILFNEDQNVRSAKTLYQCISTLGLSLILNIERSTICNTVYRWISQKQDNGIQDDIEIVEEEDSEFMTRPTSTISPQARSLLNDNYIRYKVKANQKRKSGIELLTDGVICEFLSGLEVSTKIGSQLNFINSNSLNNLNTLAFFKKYLNELSNKVKSNIDDMKNFMFGNIDTIQKIANQMLVKEYENKELQVSLISRNDDECQTDEIKKEKRKK